MNEEAAISILRRYRFPCKPPSDGGIHLGIHPYFFAFGGNKYGTGRKLYSGMIMPKGAGMVVEMSGRIQHL
jgi:hypothetical protein